MKRIVESAKRKYPRMKSISFRLTSFALILAILPVIIVSSLMMIEMERITERELLRSYQSLVSEDKGNVEEKLQQYILSIQYTAQNTTILDALSDHSRNSFLRAKDISTEVAKTITMQDRQEVKSCLVYAMTDDKVYGKYVIRSSTWIENQWLNRGWNGNTDCFLDTSWDGRRLLSIVEPLIQVDVNNLNTRRLGAIRLDLYIDELFAPSPAPNASISEYLVMLYDAQDTCIYKSNPEVNVVAGNYITISESLDGYDLRLEYLFNINELNAQKHALKQMIYPLIVLFVLFICAFATVFFKRFSRRVNALVDKFRIAATGDLIPKPPVGGNDEISMLDDQFSRMLIEMNDMNQRNAAHQDTIREARYLNLQLQINPHFLYNTLETISAIGAIHDVFQICELCEKLGNVFRYSLGKNEGKYTLLSNEIEQTKNYIYIQQVRFRFEVFYHIDVDADEVYIPRFLLQPILENSVQHGLSKRSRTGNLEINILRDRDDLVIRIRDDGVGMNKETLENVRALLCADEDDRKDNSRIGLWNISQRIRLMFGNEYGVSVQSEQDQGSEFILRMPYMTVERISDDEL